MFWSEESRPRHYGKIFGDLQKGQVTSHNCMLNRKGTDLEWARVGSSIVSPQVGWGTHPVGDSPHHPTISAWQLSFQYNQVLSLHSCWEKINYKTKSKQHSSVFQNLKRAWNSSSPLQKNYLLSQRSYLQICWLYWHLFHHLYPCVWYGQRLLHCNCASVVFQAKNTFSLTVQD